MPCPFFLYQNTRDNYYLTHIHHVVCCVALETLIQETDLYQNKFSRPDDRHIYYVAHDTPYFSTFFKFVLLCALPFVYQTIYYQGVGKWKSGGR